MKSKIHEYQKNNFKIVSKNFICKIVKSAFIFSIFFSLSCAFAQAPQKMSYQAVIRNASNALVVNAPVSVRITIEMILSGGTLNVYQERQAITTNSNGLATFEIGTGIVSIGAFANINWSNNQFQIKTYPLV